MIVLEQNCLEAARDSTGDVVMDDDGYLVFEEVDCDDPYILLQLQSMKLKKNIRLHIDIYDKNMFGGYVLYEGKKKRIPIHFNHSELINENNEEGETTCQLFYDEMLDSVNNGTYSFVIQGTNISNIYYIRKKDGKKTEFHKIE